MITDEKTGVELPVCQQVDDDVFCNEMGNITCLTCEKHVCSIHARWHHVPGLTYDVPLCTNCEAYRLRTEQS